MSIIAEFSVCSPRLALYEATSATKTVRLRVTNQFATDPSQPWLFFWAEGEDMDAFERAMAEDRSVEDVRTYTDLGSRRLYRVQISEEVDLVTYAVWVREGGSRLETTCQNGVWYNRFRFPDRESFQHVHEWCLENDLSFRLHSIFTETDDDTQSHGNSLTPEQVRTLTTAYEAGHYEIPQAVTAAEVASDLGITQQAVSERLRRAYAALIEDHVLPRSE